MYATYVIESFLEPISLKTTVVEFSKKESAIYLINYKRFQKVEIVLNIDNKIFLKLIREEKTFNYHFFYEILIVKTVYNSKLAREDILIGRLWLSVAGKCSHGGSYDDTQALTATGGINKETSDPSKSPHFRLHNQAEEAAIEATVYFLIGSDCVTNTI
ncbi:hypothetical protein KUTeg_006240 [Tegillarca granosa]|uniref:VWA7 N-terminal domain-containing protein n=1 Tax=Tegillarca granosa TaxID=220873 RepID=A0ABQ9FJ79_TEGGR|nr:hypothetical protein KUTeg_006240 [Tegillarca granosa]